VSQAETGEVKRVYDDETPFVYVCTPAYNGKVDADYAQSVANALWHAFPFGIHASVATMANSAFIELARNIFVSIFLNDPDLKGATHLFFIDSDLKFDPNAFAGVIKSCTAERPVVCGVYPRRQKELDFPCRWMPHPEISKEKGEDCLWVDDDGFLKASRVPTGFLCIRRNVLEEMAKDAIQMDVYGQEWPVPELFYTSTQEQEDGTWKMVGEDYNWSDDYVKRYDRPIDVWMNFDFVHGGYEGNFEKFLAEKVEESQGVRKFMDSKRKLGDRRKRA